jgi:WD40 repeat protein
MCVAHHPKNPSIVAAGTFNGEVCAWNLESEDYKFCSSSIGDYYHREPVTKLTWVFDLQADDYNLCSISGDGKILFWRLKDRLAYPTEGYVMMQTQGSKVHNSSTNSSSSSSSSSTNSQIIGGKSLAFCMMDKINRSFIVGSEGGIIARCFCKNGPIKASDFKNSETKWTATAAKIIAKIPNTKYQQIAKRQVETYAKEKKLKEITLASVFESKIDPTNLYPSAMDQYFESHGGPVYDLTFSPFCKKIFLTCSSDGTARLYDHTEKEPLLNLEVTSSYLYAAAWSKTRPLVFALSAEDGCVYLYDLKVNRYSPVAILKSKDEIVESKTSGTNSTSCGTSKSSTKSTCMGRENALFTLEFNPRQRNFLAAGDAMGCVHIWKLNWRLANLQTNEISTLENFKKMTTTYY